jgi:2-haloacid dehalogenase
MPDRMLTGIVACVFDAYGTLFNVASAAHACRNELGDDADRVSARWREKQLQYTWLRAAQGRHADFWQVTGDALDYTLDSLGLQKPALRERLMALYLALDPFPEVPDVLAALRRAGLTTAILSNGTEPMLEAAIVAANLGGLIDIVLSVEEVGVFKPAPAVYQLAVNRLGCAPAAIAFQSANAWDAHAAAAFGMQAVWCNRGAAPGERLPGVPAAVIATLEGLLPLLGVSAPPAGSTG